MSSFNRIYSNGRFTSKTVKLKLNYICSLKIMFNSDPSGVDVCVHASLRKSASTFIFLKIHLKTPVTSRLDMCAIIETKILYHLTSLKSGKISKPSLSEPKFVYFRCWTYFFRRKVNFSFRNYFQIMSLGHLWLNDVFS